MIGSYGSIYALGHKAVENILHGEVELTEKVDGSQISFGVIDGETIIRSKNQQLHLGADNGMFNLAVVKIVEQAACFRDNWVYRGEFFMKPKHNTLAYTRVPRNNIMIYDIEMGHGTANFLRYRDRNLETMMIGFEAVPTFMLDGEITFDKIKELLENESVLGGVKIEGVVVKNYDQFTEDKKVAKAKFVSTEFQERHSKEWKVGNPTQKDIVAQLIEELKTEARWLKSIQHMREDGRLEGSPRDIGPLIKEVQEDIIKEEEEYIKDKLYQHFRAQITRGAVAGLPDFYKEEIAKGNI